MSERDGERERDSDSYEGDMGRFNKCHNYIAFAARTVLGYTYAVQTQHAVDFGIYCSA